MTSRPTRILNPHNIARIRQHVPVWAFSRTYLIISISWRLLRGGGDLTREVTDWSAGRRGSDGGGDSEEEEDGGKRESRFHGAFFCGKVLAGTSAGEVM